ncbi:MAG: hypothetical protein WCB67_14335 [Solirubrobacteraceae bacterium]
MAIPQIPSKGAAGWSLDGLVDEMLAYYIDWRQDAAEVADAYSRWCFAPGGEEASRFSAYMAALDREQASAASYAVVVREVEHAIWGPHSLSAPV